MTHSSEVRGHGVQGAGVRNTAGTTLTLQDGGMITEEHGAREGYTAHLSNLQTEPETGGSHTARS